MDKEIHPQLRETTPLSFRSRQFALQIATLISGQELRVSLLHEAAILPLLQWNDFRLTRPIGVNFDLRQPLS